MCFGRALYLTLELEALRPHLDEQNIIFLGEAISTKEGSFAKEFLTLILQMVGLIADESASAKYKLYLPTSKALGFKPAPPPPVKKDIH